jgi:aquaporin related protein
VNHSLTWSRFRFTGTFLFLFMAFATTQVANASSSGSGGQDNGITQVPNASALTYIALGFGFSLAVNAWVFFRVSGGLFNPAVTLGMALIGAIGWVRGSLIFLAQILGSMAAAGVVLSTFPGPMNVSTTLGGGTSVVQGLCEYSFSWMAEHWLTTTQSLRCS